jgi:FkbM family methyltransferase
MKKTITFKHGNLTLLETDAYNTRALELYGELEEIQTELMLSLFEQGDVVVDIGANLGRTVVPLARKAGHLYAFEPQPRMFELLKENIAQNDLTNVTAKHMALGAAFGSAGVPGTDYDKPGDFGGCTLTLGDDVKVATLDSFNLDKCHFIKVDVEGMEADVLRGAEETIKRCKPILYVENDRLQKSVALITLVRSLDYEMYWHVPDLFNPNNFRGHRENILVGCHTINMLCVPMGVTVKQTGGLRRVVTPYDRESGRAQQLPQHVKPANGWAAVARFGGIGDNLMACSAARALKRKGLKVEVITSHEAAWQVFLHNPYIDKLSVKTKSEMPSDMLAWQKWHRGRGDEYDVFANLSHSCEATLAFFPASTQFHWPAHVRRRLANKNYLEMVHDIAGCAYDFGPLFYLNEDERDWIKETKAKVGERCIAIVMSGSRVDKTHPRLPGLVSRILSEMEVPVVLLGDPDRNFESAKQIEKLVIANNGSSKGLHIAISSTANERGERLIDWPIRRALAFCNVSDLVIGPDTGLMWGVAFEQMPKIMLLGHASPENTTKHWINTTTLHPNQQRVHCWPCHQLHEAEGGTFPQWCTPNEDKSGAACISDISIETIMQHVKSLWQQQETTLWAKTASQVSVVREA